MKQVRHDRFFTNKKLNSNQDFPPAIGRELFLLSVKNTVAEENGGEEEAASLRTNNGHAEVSGKCRNWILIWKGLHTNRL